MIKLADTCGMPKCTNPITEKGCVDNTTGTQYCSAKCCYIHVTAIENREYLDDTFTELLFT